MTYPVQKPPKLLFRNDSGRTTPLTSVEIDGNFVLLDYNINQKLNMGDFTSNKIIDLLNDDSLSSSESGIDAGRLVGKRPSSNPDINTIVSRDSQGNFSAKEITANKFIGESTKAVDAKTSTKLKTPIKINDVPFDGSFDVTIYDNSKISKSGDTTSGKINFVSPTTAPINIKINTTVPTLTDGDILYHGGSLKMRVGGVTKKIAFLDDNINGSAVNVTGTVEIYNGGTGAKNTTDARKNLYAAKNGVNDDITEIRGLTVALAPNLGGTGIKEVGESGNIMVSNGVSWETKSVIDVMGIVIDDKVEQSVPNAIDLYVTNQSHAHKESTGYAYMLGGIIVNWGTFSISETTSSQIVSFDRIFPNGVLHVFVTQTDNSDRPIGVINKTKQYATISKSALDKNQRTGSWLAIGY